MFDRKKSDALFTDTLDLLDILNTRDGRFEYADYVALHNNITALYDSFMDCKDGCGYCEKLYAAYSRLAAYEDSGLSPEEVQELKVSVKICEDCWNHAQAKADGRLVVLPETGIGDLSDGYHTFNELYHHRAILFSVICNEHPDISWKSKLHHDGTMFDGMFIVGINTPEGQATYHYDINPYWDMFRVRELEKAPEWDGHTSEQAIERIAGLTREAAEKALEQQKANGRAILGS